MREKTLAPAILGSAVSDRPRFAPQMSKESTLADAIDYIQELRGRKEELQRELQEIADAEVELQGSASSPEERPPPEPVDCKVPPRPRPIHLNQATA